MGTCDPALGPLPPTFVKVDDDELSGNISLNYSFTDTVSVFGRFAHGFRAPSIQGRVLFGNAVTVADSETVDSFELGIKSELFDNRLRLNATVYTLEMSDQQVTAGSGEANANQLLNVDTTKGQGLELDMNWAAKLASYNLSLSSANRRSTSRWRPKLLTIECPVNTSSA